MHQAIIEYPTPKCLVKELDRVAEQIQELQQYQTRLQLSSNFTAAILEQAPAEHTAIWQHFGNSITLCVFIKVPGFTCEAAPGLCQYLEFIADFYDTPPVSMDNPNSSNRVYHFAPLDPEISISIHVFAELEENSENCQRIIVGLERRKSFKLVEVDEPVYAFKC